MARNGAMVAYQGEVRFEHGRRHQQAAQGGRDRRVARLIQATVPGEPSWLRGLPGRRDAARERLADGQPRHLALEAGIHGDITGSRTGRRACSPAAFQRCAPRVRASRSYPGAPRGSTWPRRQRSRSAGRDRLVRRRHDDPQVRVQAKSLIGMGSGESFQLGLSGQGWVLVQPSEGRFVASSSRSAHRQRPRSKSPPFRRRAGAPGRSSP